MKNRIISSQVENHQVENQPDIPVSVAFIHGFLDEYGLDPYEFRLYAHIVRRTGGKPQGVCFASIATISAVCKISMRKTQQVIKNLISANFIVQNKRPGRTDEYRVRPATEWILPKDLERLRQDLKDSERIRRESIVKRLQISGQEVTEQED